ncbi:MAG: SIMPL domain-containing protein [Candidatus Pacebacteria bacterium]|nr:SIMPL domain-containing protein [Candidatus Paceibacterota bacterium]
MNTPSENNIKTIVGDPVVRIALVGVLAILALFLLVQTIDGVQNFGTSTNPPTNTITVTGEGTATAIPDTATVSFGVTATAKDVATAEKNVTDTINKALSSVKDAGITDSDITTTSFNVSPHYTTPVCPPGGTICPNTTSTQSGYDVTENVQVKITDTSKVATILQGLSAANVTNVSGPDFVVGDPSAVQAQARGQAIQKAQVDAKKLAGQLGVSLGKIVSFSDSSSGVTPQSMFKAEAAVSSSAVTPTIPVGNNEYTDDVSITYSIH